MADAWHLPGWTVADGPDGAAGITGDWHRGTTASGSGFCTPVLDAEAADTVAAHVREAALEVRRTHAIAEVVQAIDAVARRLAGDSTAEREAVALMSESLGWPPALTRETLAEARRGWTLDELQRLLDTELGDPRVLDGFVADPSSPSRLRRATGPPLLFQVLAANVPGVAVTAIVRGLLVRSGVLCKSAGDEPFLPALFARLLAEEDPALGRTVAVTWWPSESDTDEWVTWSRRADLAVVYGGPEAVAGVRTKLPTETELLVYGPRVGIGVVLGPAAVEPKVAQRLARDVCAYEQQGCVSPRLVFVVDGDVQEFAKLLARGLDEETRRQPPPELAEADAVAIRTLRAEREFERPGSASLLASDPDLRWTVVVDSQPRVAATNLPRVVQLSPARSVGDILTALQPLSGHIQALGYAGKVGAEELAEGAASLGVSRVAPFGRLAWPPVDWRHDGRHQLIPLLRWTDWEREE